MVKKGKGAAARAAVKRRMQGRQVVMAEVLEAPCGWGGRRKRAGRKPKGAKAGVAHGPRPFLEGGRVPVHVTLKMVKKVKYLRGFRTYPVIRRALCAAAERHGMRIIHFSVQGNHIHLIVEAEDAAAMGRGMRALGVRLARQLNRKAGRKGRVLADRYHAHYLKTPSEARRAIVYVLQNGVKHRVEECSASSGHYVFDPYSSAAYFKGWSARCHKCLPARDAPGHPLHKEEGDQVPVVAPHVWLLYSGWRRAGDVVEPWEVPRAH